MEGKGRCLVRVFLVGGIVCVKVRREVRYGWSKAIYVVGSLEICLKGSGELWIGFKKRSDRVRVLFRKIFLVVTWGMDFNSEVGGRGINGEV